MKDSSLFFRTQQNWSDHTACLQKEIEQVTQNLEFEKRESSYIEEQIKLFQYEISSLPKSYKSSISSLKSQITVLKRKLDLEVTTLNKAKNSNRNLRSQINEYRLDKSAHKQSLIAISENLDKTSKETGKKLEENLKTEERDEEQHERIFKIRAKSANQRSVFEEKMSTLNSMLKNVAGNLNTTNIEDKTYAVQSIEVIRVLKTISKFSQTFTVDKKRHLEQYLKHIHSLEVGFASLKSATGINIIEDIVTSCLKSEEQNNQILEYLNNLTSEIDLLEEKQKNYSLKIQALKGSKSKGEVSLQEFNTQNDQNLKELEKNLQQKKLNNEKTLRELQTVLPLLKKIYLKLQNFHFAGLKIEHLDLDSIEKLNKESAGSILGNIEDFSMTLATILKLKYEDFSVLLQGNGGNSEESEIKPLVAELLEEKDLFMEAGFDEIKVPISVEEMKNKAMVLYQNRKSFIKSKPNTPDQIFHKRLQKLG